MLDPLPHSVQTVLETLESAGYEAFLVGGCVRDQFLRRPLHDFDVTTNAHPLDVMSLFAHTVPTGLQHGTVTVLMGKTATEVTAIEVTTYRRDIGYSDGRHPDDVQFSTSLTEDLARRDFTVNAIALDLRGALVDPFGGLSDLQHRRIRAVGIPRDRFSEDGLRILRALRFATELSFTIDDDTYQAMQDEADTLKKVSSERIGAEIERIASAPWWLSTSLLSAKRIWEPLGRLSILRDAIRESDGLLVNRSMTAWETDCSREEQIVMSFALWCFTQQLSKLEASQLGRDLKWPRRRIHMAGMVQSLLACDSAEWSPQGWRWKLYDSGLRTVYLACLLFDMMDSKGIDHLKLCEQFTKEQPIWSESELAITGHDIALLGADGPVIGGTKRYLIGQVLEGLSANDAGVLRMQANHYIEQLGRGENHHDRTI